MMLTIRDVEEAVCARFHLTPGDLRGRGRSSVMSRPRMIAMYLARHLTGNSLPRIGGYFRRDHTTVLAAVRRVDELSRKNEAFHATLEECRALLLQSTPWKAQVARGMERAS